MCHTGNQAREIRDDYAHTEFFIISCGYKFEESQSDDKFLKAIIDCLLCNHKTRQIKIITI